MLSALLVAAFIQLTGPDGQVIYLDTSKVITIRQPRGTDKGHWAAGTRCLVFTDDGKFITTVNTCDDIRKALQGTPNER
jgi:hypothetical protein